MPPETPVLLTTTQAAPIPSPHVAVFASTAAGLHCAMPSQSLGRNRGLGDLDAELEQLAMDLGAPHSGFSKLILRMRSRTSLPICGRPNDLPKIDILKRLMIDVYRENERSVRKLTTKNVLKRTALGYLRPAGSGQRPRVDHHAQPITRSSW